MCDMTEAALSGGFSLSKKACHCEPVLTLAWQSVSKPHNSCTFPQIPG